MFTHKVTTETNCPIQITFAKSYPPFESCVRNWPVGANHRIAQVFIATKQKRSLTTLRRWHWTLILVWLVKHVDGIPFCARITTLGSIHKLAGHWYSNHSQVTVSEKPLSQSKAFGSDKTTPSFRERIPTTTQMYVTTVKLRHPSAGEFFTMAYAGQIYCHG